MLRGGGMGGMGRGYPAGLYYKTNNEATKWDSNTKPPSI